MRRLPPVQQMSRRQLSANMQRSYSLCADLTHSHFLFCRPPHSRRAGGALRTGGKVRYEMRLCPCTAVLLVPIVDRWLWRPCPACDSEPYTAAPKSTLSAARQLSYFEPGSGGVLAHAVARLAAALKTEATGGTGAASDMAITQVRVPAGLQSMSQKPVQRWKIMINNHSCAGYSRGRRLAFL